MLLFSSRANQISTNVKTNQMANKIAVMTRFLRQYSWCLSVSCIGPPLDDFPGIPKRESRAGLPDDPGDASRATGPHPLGKTLVSTFTPIAALQTEPVQRRRSLP